MRTFKLNAFAHAMNSCADIYEARQVAWSEYVSPLGFELEDEQRDDLLEAILCARKGDTEGRDKCYERMDERYAEYLNIVDTIGTFLGFKYNAIRSFMSLPEFNEDIESAESQWKPFADIGEVRDYLISMTLPLRKRIIAFLTAPRVKEIAKQVDMDDIWQLLDVQVPFVPSWIEDANPNEFTFAEVVEESVTRFTRLPDQQAYLAGSEHKQARTPLFVRERAMRQGIYQLSFTIGIVERAKNKMVREAEAEYVWHTAGGSHLVQKKKGVRPLSESEEVLRLQLAEYDNHLRYLHHLGVELVERCYPAMVELSKLYIQPHLALFYALDENGEYYPMVNVLPGQKATIPTEVHRAIEACRAKQEKAYRESKQKDFQESFAKRLELATQVYNS